MSSPLYIREGMDIAWDGINYVVHSVDTQIFVLKAEDGAFSAIKPNEIYRAYSDKQLKVVEQPKNGVLLQPLQDPDKIDELARLTQCFHLLEKEKFPMSGAARKKVIDVVYSDYKKISPSKLYRDFREWKNAGGSLINLKSLRVSKRQSKFSSEILDLVDEIIDDYFLSLNGENVSQCYQKLKEKHKQKGIKQGLMSRSQFYEICNSIDQYEYTVARHGREQARKLLQNANEVIWAEYPLQYVEIDAVHLNLGILSETGDFLGTLIIYVCIDRFTRCVLGFSTSIKREKRGEQSGSVIQCIKHCILPKSKSDYCENEWCSFGLPTYFISDAGSAFHNAAVNAYILNIESSRIITQTKTPKKKPFIERFFRTLRAQFAMRIPGYAGKRSDEISLDETIKDMATVTQAQVEELLTVFICDYYHQSSHRGLDNRTPQEVWQEYYDNSHMSPRLPNNPEAVDVYAGTVTTGSLSLKSGIRVNKFSYNHKEKIPELFFEIAGNRNRSILIDFIVNDADISKIYVIDPRSGELMLVPNTDKRVSPGTSLAKYNATRSSRPENKKYLSSDDSAIDDILGQNKRNKRTAPKKQKKDSSGSPAVTPALTASDLASMMAVGRARVAQGVDDEFAVDGRGDDFFDGDALDDFETEEK